jgi:hypothetical protein
MIFKASLSSRPDIQALHAVQTQSSPQSVNNDNITIYYMYHYSGM